MLIQEIAAKPKIIAKVLPHAIETCRAGVTKPVDISGATEAMQSQLSYLGVINEAQIHRVQESGEKLLHTCLAKMDVIPMNSDIKLCKREGTASASWLLMDKPRQLSESLDIIQNANDELLNSGRHKYGKFYIMFDPSKAKEAIANGELPNIKIKGRVGAGLCSSAFLTEDNRVLKLTSLRPNYPTPETHVSTIEIPIQKTYSSKNGAYGTITPFTEVGELYFLKPNGEYDMEKFNKMLDEKQAALDFYNITHGTNFEFKDFKKNDTGSLQQFGHLDGKFYLLDSDCIKRK